MLSRLFCLRAVRALLLLSLCFLGGFPLALAATHGGGEKKETPATEHGGGEAAASEEGGGESSSGHGGSKKDKKKGEEQTVFGGLFAGDPVYLRLKPIIFPIINDNGTAQIVTMLAEIQIKDVETANKLSLAMPKVRDALIQGVYGKLADRSFRNANVLDIPEVKDKIKDSINTVFGEGTVVEVLVQGIAQRKM